MIEVRGIDEATGAIGALSKEGWKDKELGSWADDERGMLDKEPYPPQKTPKRPSQRYIRTYRLKRSYRVQRPRRMVRVITNRASTARSGFYGGYVVGQQQAAVHFGHWYIMADLIEADLPKLTKKIGIKGVRIFEAH